MCSPALICQISDRVYCETRVPPLLSHILYLSLPYCNCCSGPTGHTSSRCCGMRLIQSDSRAVSACLSRTARNPAGLCLPGCLFPQDTGLFSGDAREMQPGSRYRDQEFVLLFKKKVPLYSGSAVLTTHCFRGLLNTGRRANNLHLTPFPLPLEE